MDFKFQYDSINTACSFFMVRPLVTLNSNLILLILMSAALTNNNATCFKFQSDSINTIIAAAVLLIPKIFKFQSDFINTSQTTTS